MSSVRSLYQPQSQEYFFKLYSFNFFVQVHDPLWIKKISPLLLGRGQKWQPTPIFLPGGFHGQRSLAGYSPWGHKESDTIEQLNIHRGVKCLCFPYEYLVCSGTTCHSNFPLLTVLVSQSKTIWPQCLWTYWCTLFCFINLFAYLFVRTL